MKVLVYDLPSENHKVLQSNRGLYSKVRATRVWCVERLHKLGVQCTMSVILVSPEREGLIEDAITSVKARYLGLSLALREGGVDLMMEPLIRVLPLTSEQEATMRELGARRLIEVIDSGIERINRLMEGLDEITEESQRRTVVYNLNRFESEVQDLASRAREVGIELPRDFEYLVSLIDEARRRLQS